MSFAKNVDKMISQVLETGGLPDVDTLMESVPGPSYGGNNAGPKGKRNREWVFSDADETPQNFPSASRGRDFTAPKFSQQNSSIPPALFKMAAKIHENDVDTDALAAVLLDFEEVNAED